MSLYSVQIIKVGESAAEALSDDMLIIFNDSAPVDVAEYCFIHTHDTLKGNIIVGGNVVIDDVIYPITAVGEGVSQNLGNLGHITLRFDGGDIADFVGSLHLMGKQPTTITVGSTLVFN